ncbi:MULTISPECIES: SRPBCC family protein [unclassified Chelatococcus]|uniref:SRPBCC family protein n=1 Tax=unclassified Chelatococcus TaxID=2638111 RepID=UPI001BD1B7DB|nr:MULTISPECIES: SRPBCC family protein [unclassified Chelatococcus]CAH1651066.1 carbon monoxide dehydrogenase G protein [Hyphomicrobiales bacterium]MBS7743223.1 SRPBCC family protein [Chelatococcus sp. HY11]MBX3541659.1 SRPBCC family protein [Chelatococcus sp.]MCO5074449.1 SRPBCC family protein [Chelatococcus sp.]CAH1693015.1 carbon monoxide dehydrogenase G protein [Hyphomicrobiales bacterium]
MKIAQEFTVARPMPAVWSFFQDIPNVARCLPGAEYLGPKEDGKHTGKVSSKIGPFQASFEGEADVVYDDVAKSVHVEGKGVDKKGASRGKMIMDCRLFAEGEKTKVVVDADVQLSGAIAQFGRTGIIAEVANVLVADFVRNAEAELAAGSAAAQDAAPAQGRDTAREAGAAPAASAPSAPAGAKPISGFGLILAVLKSWLASLFGRRAH